MADRAFLFAANAKADKRRSIMQSITPRSWRNTMALGAVTPSTSSGLSASVIGPSVSSPSSAATVSSSSSSTSAFSSSSAASHEPPMQTNICGFSRLTTDLPPVIDQTCLYLEKHALTQEGVFRIPGSMNDIKTTKKLYDKGKRVNLQKESNAHTVAGVLKLFFCELPNGIFTFELYDSFVAAAALPDPVEFRLACIRQVVDRLPPGNYAVIKRVTSMFRVLQNFSDANKMTARNIAIVMGPTMLRCRNESLRDIMASGSYRCRLLQHLILDHDTIFLNPKEVTEKPLENIPESLGATYDAFILLLQKDTIMLAQSIVEEGGTTTNKTTNSVFAIDSTRISSPAISRRSTYNSISMAINSPPSPTLGRSSTTINLTSSPASPNDLDPSAIVDTSASKPQSEIRLPRVNNAGSRRARAHDRRVGMRMDGDALSAAMANAGLQVGDLDLHQLGAQTTLASASDPSVSGSPALHELRSSAPSPSSSILTPPNFPAPLPPSASSPSVGRSGFDDSMVQSNQRLETNRAFSMSSPPAVQVQVPMPTCIPRQAMVNLQEMYEQGLYLEVAANLEEMSDSQRSEIEAYLETL